MPRPKFAARVVAEPDLTEGAFDRLQASIDPEWIDEALEATGTATLRRRRLPAEQVIWLVLGMALYRDRRIDELVAKLDLALPGRRGVSPAPSSVTQARARLGDEPLRWLFERCSEHWAHSSAREHAWRGLAVYGVDGTTVRVPDSTENRAHFGTHSAGAERGESGYPLARVVTLMALRTHLVAAMRFGPFSVGEKTYAKGLWAQVPDHSLVIVDRNFYDAAALFPLQDHGASRHWLIRARRDVKWRTVEKFGPGDELVETQPNHTVRDNEPSIPKRWVMRAIRYQRRGFPPQTLLTSMLDPRAFPAEEVAALYHERWEIELGYGEVKTRMLERFEAIRSRRPIGVAQELWGVALAYNLVRLEMTRIADEAGVPPTRISFTMALGLIRDEWGWCAVTSPGAIPKHLRKLRAEVARFVLPPRRERSCPRAVKLKMSNYPRKRP
ncbi:MAG TPA: IS4 family transposase, partial [Candidatus Polarisedimenticolia bacterium]|nr:IS4 family transposase [Candidatus Polarisedimenticolia bacterium]